MEQPLVAIHASVASDRQPDGLRTELSTIFKVVDKIRCIIAEETVTSVYLPLLGAGKGGVTAEIALHTVLAALLDSRCKSGGHHFREIHLVVYAPEGRPPELAPTRVANLFEHILGLYQTASQ